MEQAKKSENTLVIIIPNSDIRDLDKFRKGILSVLSKVKIDNCDPEFKDNLKAVYELLSHLKLDNFLKSQSGETNEKLSRVSRNVVAQS